MAEQTPHEQSIDLMARYLIWQQVDVEKIRWEDFPEIGEFDWERIADRFEELAPECPDMHERQDAYEYLTRLADHEPSEARQGDTSGVEA